jgi:hypothetical protein
MIMNTYNLEQVVGFPMRVSKNKGTLIGNIFLDKPNQIAFQFIP